MWTGATNRVGVTTLLLGFTSYISGEMGQSVLLCDANFRNQKLATLWGLPQEPGFAELLAGTAQPKETIHNTEIPGLYVLPSGDPKVITTVMGSRKIHPKETIAKLSNFFGLVLLDSAPPNSSPESCFLASQVDGVLVVVNAEKTRRQVFRATAERLESAGASIMGGVLNRRKYHIPNWIYRHLG